MDLVLIFLLDICRFHSTLISMSSLTPGYYVESLWTLFTCLQKLNKCLTNKDIVVLLRYKILFINIYIYNMIVEMN